MDWECFKIQELKLIKSDRVSVGHSGQIPSFQLETTYLQFPIFF